jgi:hypothetical protein
MNRLVLSPSMSYPRSPPVRQLRAVSRFLRSTLCYFVLAAWECRQSGKLGQSKNQQLASIQHRCRVRLPHASANLFDVNYLRANFSTVPFTVPIGDHPNCSIALAAFAEQRASRPATLSSRRRGAVGLQDRDRHRGFGRLSCEAAERRAVPYHFMKNVALLAAASSSCIILRQEQGRALRMRMQKAVRAKEEKINGGQPTGEWTP